jgi:hypothetical protein
MHKEARRCETQLSLSAAAPRGHDPAGLRCPFEISSKLSGVIADADKDSFPIELSMTAENRRKMSEQLYWRRPPV